MNKAVLYDAYAYLFSRTRFYRWNRLLFYLSARGLGMLNHKDNVVSGEDFFLREFLSQLPSPVVFDVGANEGMYSLDALKANPDARIFAFEPHPLTYKRLTAAVASSGVVTIPAACGKTHGTMTLYDHADSSGSGHASLQKGVIEELHKAQAAQFTIDVINLDTFAAEKNVPFIHLLKIDTEGFELEVLRGAAGLLQQRRIGAIQFEFNEMNVVGRTFFKDFCDYLPGYSFYRTLRDGLIPLGAYSPFWCEIFAFQNIVALPGDDRRPSEIQ